MFVKVILCGILFIWFPACLALPTAEDGSSQTARSLAAGDIAQWTMGLVMVLGVFFLCVWGVRRLSGITVNEADKMRVVGGLSLGMREKIILVQVGKKQLILGVTPGRIQALHVLEGEDCLIHEEMGPSTLKSGFALKLMQAIKARSDA
ncbi:MAG: flagellar biosynthetic protein FliO [Methylosarcina sp.]